MTGTHLHAALWCPSIRDGHSRQQLTGQGTASSVEPSGLSCCGSHPNAPVRHWGMLIMHGMYLIHGSYSDFE